MENLRNKQTNMHTSYEDIDTNISSIIGTVEKTHQRKTNEIKTNQTS